MARIPSIQTAGGSQQHHATWQRLEIDPAAGHGKLDLDVLNLSELNGQEWV
jgi:hypothetical protein